MASERIQHKYSITLRGNPRRANEFVFMNLKEIDTGNKLPLRHFDGGAEIRE